MKTLIITLGVPASGKSTWIKEQGLEDFTLSPDIIRLQFQAPQTNINGTCGITQKNDKAVWAHLFTLLENRMKNGDLTVIDATHTRSSLINRYRNLAKEYRYRIIAIDFRDIPLETLHSRNNLRGVKMVPPSVIDNMHARIKHNEIPGWISLTKPDAFTLNSPLEDYNEYNSLRFIGDTHDCATELTTLLEDSYEDNQLTVFLGDLFDRGPDPVGVFRLIEANPEWKLIEGNHDSHLVHYRDYATNVIDAPSLSAFRKRANCRKQTLDTFNKFKEAGITYKDVSRLRQRYWQLFHVKFDDRRVFACHAGYPTIPSIKTSSREFVKGVGTYGDIEAIHQSWIDMVSHPKAVQIHGHRNPNKHRVEVLKDRIYNANGDCEFGGHLHAVVISKGKDIRVVSTKALKTYCELPALKRPIPIATEPSGNLYTDMINHKMVIVKEAYEGVFACNFSRKAFKEGKFDETSTNARGLFIRQDGSVVARGYHKFFNHNEQEATRNEALKENLQFPVEKYSKSNGFIGLLTYDTVANKWFISSKSSLTSEHAGWFKTQITPYLTDELKKYVQAMNITIAFEVIEPTNDPHIVKYEKPHLVLLDAISNSRVFNKVEYKALKLIHKVHFSSAKIKTLKATFSNWDELSSDIRAQDKANTNSHLLTQKGNEGYVYEDSSMYMFKFKSRWYRFWKHMRTMAIRVSKIQPNTGHAQQMREKLHSISEVQVVNFMLNNITKHTDLPIISIRDHYFEEH